jgi:hypothetical protein
MTKFQKCVVVWMVYLAYLIFLTIICSTFYALPRYLFVVLLSPAFVAAFILTIVFCARKPPAKTPGQECESTHDKQS